MAIWKKLTSVFMSVVLVVGLCPSMAFAQGGGVQVASTGLTAQNEGELVKTDIYPVNEELMFKFVNAYLEQDGDAAALVFALSGSGYEYVYAGTFDEAWADLDAIKEAYPNKATSGKLVYYQSAEVDQNYATDRAIDNPSYQEHADGVKAKYQFRVPITDSDALAAIKAGTGSFRVPIVAVSKSRADKGTWDTALTARQAVVDLDAKKMRTGNYQDELEATATSSLSTMPVEAAAKIKTIGTKSANEFTCQPTFTVTNGAYDKAFIGTAEAAAAAASGTIDADEGAFTIAFLNSLGKTPVIDVETWQATVAFHVADGASFAEAGTWVERTLTVNPEAKTIGIAGAELTAQLAKPFDGDTVQFVKDNFTDTFGMLSNTNHEDMVLKRYGGKVHISFTPNNQTVYDGFYINASTDGFPAGGTYPVEGYSDSDWIAAKGTAGNFTYDFALPESYCGYAWPVVPVKTAAKNGGTTSAQYYLTIPALDKIEVGPADGLYSLPNMSAGPGDMFNHMIPGSRYLKVDGDTATIMFVQDASTKSVAKYSRIALGKSSELVETAYQPTLPEGTTIVEGVDAGTGANGTKWGFEIPVDKEQAASLLDRDPDSEDAKLYITIWNNQGASSNGNVPGWYKASSDNYITLGALGEEAADSKTYDLVVSNNEKMFKVVKATLEDHAGVSEQDYLMLYLSGSSYGWAFSGGQDEAVATFADKETNAKWAKQQGKTTFDSAVTYGTYDGGTATATNGYGFKIPVTVPAGETAFSFDVVAYATDYTARNFAIDLEAGTLKTGSASDVASLEVESSVADIAAAEKGSLSYTGYVRPYAGNQDASSNPLSNDFVGKLTLNLGAGSVYDQAYAVTYQGTPYVKVETAKKSDPLDSDYATVGTDGTLELPFYNEYDSSPKTVQLNGNKITVMMHVADSAPYAEAGTWVERTFQLDFTNRTSGKLSISGEALKTPITGAEITLGGADGLVYNGASQHPAIEKVMLGETELKAGIDFTVSYADVLGEAVEETADAGSYQVVLTGIGEYGAQASAEFSIAPLQLTDDNLDIVSATPDKAEFTGEDIDVAVTARVLVKAAEEGTPAQYVNLSESDFMFIPGTVSAVGSYDVTVIGKGNYTGRVTKKDAVSIVGVDLEKPESNAVLAPAGEVVYTGSAIDVDWTLSYGAEGTSTVPADAYDIAYSVEGEGLTGTLSEDGKPLTAGTYKVTATATGDDFTGKVDATLTVGQFDLSSDEGDDAKVAIEVAGKPYTGAEQVNGEVSVTFNGTALNASDFEVVEAKGTDAGDYAVTVNGKGNFKGSKQASFTVEPVSLADVAELAPIANGVYTGSANEPEVVVSKKDGSASYALSASDYDVTFNADPVSVGTYQVTVSAKEGGNYTGSLEGEYAIDPLEIGAKGVTVDAIAPETFDGSVHAPEPTVKFNGNALSKGSDYTLEYGDDMTSAGDKVVTINGQGNFTGSTTASFKVSKLALDKSMVRFKSGELWTADYSTSDASEQPAVGIAVGDEVYTDGFAVRYAGSNAVVTAKAEGNFSGSASAAWNVAVLSLDGGSVALGTSKFTYTGEAQVPSVKVTVPGSGTLKAADYSVSYLNAAGAVIDAGDVKDAGDYTVLVSGKGNYGGQLSASFTIEPLAIDAGSVSVEGIPVSMTYNGAAAAPEPTVSFGAGVLEAGKDYAVSYADNEKAGTAKVIIAGKGNFNGEKTVEFTIAKDASLNGATFKIVGADGNDLGSYDYTGKAVRPDVKVVSRVDGTEYAGTKVAVYTNNVKAGTAKVTVVATGNYSGTISAEYQVAALNIENASVSLASACKYTGKALEPSLAVTYQAGDEAIELVEGVDYGVEYTNNVNVGTASAVLVGSGNFEGVKFADFEISKGASKVTLAAKSAKYTGKSISIGKATVSGSTGAVTYAYYSDAKCTKSVAASKVVNAGTYYVKATVAADANYAKATSAAAKLTITKIDNTMTASTNNQTLKLADVNKKNQTIKAAKAFTIKKALGKVSYAKNKKDTNKGITVASNGTITVKKATKAGTYKVKVDVTAAGDANHNKSTKTVTLQIVVKK